MKGPGAKGARWFLLVVDGDPNEDITVLQARDRIEQIILDGEIVDMDRQLESWPNQPSYVYTDGYLTQDVARGAANGWAPTRRRAEAAPVTALPGDPIAE